jgi:ribosomal protein S6
LDVIGPIKEEMKKVLNDYQEEKAREKAIHAEIGRKRDWGNRQLAVLVLA